MKYQDYCFDGTKNPDLEKMPAGVSGVIWAMKEELIERTGENQERIALLQKKLYAQGKEGLVILLQGMDCSGKDSLVKSLMKGFNPQGVKIYSFKAPTGEELSHDFLWRIGRCLPARGEIAIFNRSHYEDAVTVQVKNLWQGFSLPSRCMGDDFIEKRLEHIKAFEKYLHDSGIAMVKLFLHISREEQKTRLLQRLDKPEKNWKFSPEDVKDRALWDEYMAAYQKAMAHTAAPYSPWYVLPADQKWFARYLASEAVLDALEKMNPQYPPLDEKDIALLPAYRKQLMEE